MDFWIQQFQEYFFCKKKEENYLLKIDGNHVQKLLQNDVYTFPL